MEVEEDVLADPFPALGEIGACGAIQAPVYFSAAPAEALVRELHRLLGLRDGPFVLLTPTGSAWNAEVEAVLRGRAVAHVSLASILDVGPAKVITSKANTEAVFADFARRAAAIRDDSGTLKSIHREIAAVRSELVELRSAKQRLEKMLADGLFAFTQRVDPASFKVLCCVLAEGDVAKASRTLGVPDGSVRTMIRRWRGMGKEYRAMLDLVRWRKAVGRKETVLLNDNVLLGKAESVDYPGLVADVLERVTDMTGDNWEEKAEELEEVLRASVNRWDVRHRLGRSVRSH